METTAVCQGGGNHLERCVGVPDQLKGPDGAGHLTTKPGMASFGGAMR